MLKWHEIGSQDERKQQTYRPAAKGNHSRSESRLFSINRTETMIQKWGKRGAYRQRDPRASVRYCLGKQKRCVGVRSHREEETEAAVCAAPKADNVEALLDFEGQCASAGDCRSPVLCLGLRVSRQAAAQFGSKRDQTGSETDARRRVIVRSNALYFL